MPFILALIVTISGEYKCRKDSELHSFNNRTGITITDHVIILIHIKTAKRIGFIYYLKPNYSSQNRIKNLQLLIVFHFFIAGKLESHPQSKVEDIHLNNHVCIVVYFVIVFAGCFSHFLRHNLYEIDYYIYISTCLFDSSKLCCLFDY